jgi:hypothetical protein
MTSAFRAFVVSDSPSPARPRSPTISFGKQHLRAAGADSTGSRAHATPMVAWLH